ncbi:MAG: 50S ribosomal protein L35 [Alphaproteobacteria bacterium]|nr:50S ribosomal protein L35 [Alphaproteobacteria bacterium]HCS24105.1 50S ribosomal protein L35 [Rhodospirillaceae bacterium]
MPKMKTHSGAKKRFSVTRRGKVQARAAHKRHRLVSKSKKMKRDSRATLIMADMDAKIILDNFLPYERSKKRKTRQQLKKQMQLNAKNKAKKEAA